MKPLRKDSLRTRARLLTAAGEVFAKRGYRDATVAEICERAKANIAAVGYHFGGKEALYREAWKHSFAESLKAHPLDGGVSDEDPPEERLRGHVAALVHRVEDENNREFLIVHKELANPTGLLEKVMKECLRPLQEKMEKLVRELLGPRASGAKVRLCAISVVSQCVHPIVARRMLKGREGGGGPPDIGPIGAYIDHVTDFSLAGIREGRRICEKNVR